MNIDVMWPGLKESGSQCSLVPGLVIYIIAGNLARRNPKCYNSSEDVLLTKFFIALGVLNYNYLILSKFKKKKSTILALFSSQRRHQRM